jgi:hypothetical protein
MKRKGNQTISRESIMKQEIIKQIKDYALHGHSQIDNQETEIILGDRKRVNLSKQEQIEIQSAFENILELIKRIESQL